MRGRSSFITIAFITIAASSVKVRAQSSPIHFELQPFPFRLEATLQQQKTLRRRCVEAWWYSTIMAMGSPTSSSPMAT